MNQRIRLLAKQAGLRFTQLMSNPMVPVVDGRETDLEKFAQSVINECVQACINEGKTYEVKSAGEYQSATFADAIKKHFGVEE